MTVVQVQELVHWKTDDPAILRTSCLQQLLYTAHNKEKDQYVTVTVFESLSISVWPGWTPTHHWHTCVDGYCSILSVLLPFAASCNYIIHMDTWLST
jgi:hypothetical protein